MATPRPSPRARSPKARVRAPRPPSGASLRELVDRYVRDFRPARERERRRYAALPSLAEAVRHAALGLAPDGRRHPHQRRVAKRALARAHAALSDADLAACSYFDELFVHVGETAGAIQGFGELAVYDAALRLGAHLGLEPVLVYLHAGARKGAEALGLPHREHSLTMEELPPELRALSPREAEDFLCVYKGELEGRGAGGTRCAPAPMPKGGCARERERAA